MVQQTPHIYLEKITCLVGVKFRISRGTNQQEGGAIMMKKMANRANLKMRRHQGTRGVLEKNGKSPLTVQLQKW